MSMLDALSGQVVCLVGVALAWWLGRHRIAAGRLPGTGPAAFDALVLCALAGVVVFGHAGYLLFYRADALSDPAQWIAGGDARLSFNAGLAGLALATWAWARWRAVRWIDTLDLIAPLVPLVLAFDALGTAVGGASEGWPGAAARAGLFAVLWWYTRWPRPRYAAVGLLLVGLAGVRCVLDLLSVWLPGPPRPMMFTPAQHLLFALALSMPLALPGGYCLWRSRRAFPVSPGPTPAASSIIAKSE